MVILLRCTESPAGPAVTLVKGRGRKTRSIELWIVDGAVSPGELADKRIMNTLETGEQIKKNERHDIYIAVLYH